MGFTGRYLRELGFDFLRVLEGFVQLDRSNGSGTWSTVGQGHNGATAQCGGVGQGMDDCGLALSRACGEKTNLVTVIFLKL